MIKVGKQNILFLAAAVSIIFLTVLLYVRSERFFYYWDFGGYHGVSTEVTTEFERSIRGGISTILHSIDQEYNRFFVVPLLPFTLTLGTSRLVYILAIALVYLLPTALVFGWISTIVAQEASPRIFWSGVFLTLLIPASWSSVLRGYPDIGGILLLALGLLFFLYDIELAHWWQILLVGFFLAAAPIFRRHFSFASLAFFVSTGIYYWGAFAFRGIKTKSFLWRKLMREMLSLFLTSIVSIATIFLIARTFLERIISNDYHTLYLSYAKPSASILAFFQQELGWLLWVLAISGIISGLFLKIVRRDVLLFILLLGAYTILQWVVLVRQTGPHYVLQILFLIIIGLVGFVKHVLSRPGGPSRSIAGVISVSLVLFNFAYSLAPLSFVPNLFEPFLSWNYRPLIRPDYDEVVELLHYLRSLPDPRNPIYVVDSSSTMNYDLLHKAEQALYGDDIKLGFLVTPQVDSRDYYPLEQMLQAHYVILSSPSQTHLNPTQQRVVRFVYDAFTQHLEIAQDFSELPRTFQLAGGVTLHIFKRERPTSLETSIRTFDAMVKYISRKPGEQLDWMVLNLDSGDVVQNTDGDSYVFHISNKKLKEGRFFLYSEAIQQPGYVKGKLRFDNPHCPGAVVTGKAIDPAGNIVDAYAMIVTPQNNRFETKTFSPLVKGNYLVFEVKRLQGSLPPGICSLSVLWMLRND